MTASGRGASVWGDENTLKIDSSDGCEHTKKHGMICLKGSILLWKLHLKTMVLKRYCLYIYVNCLCHDKNIYIIFH